MAVNTPYAIMLLDNVLSESKEGTHVPIKIPPGHFIALLKI